MNYDNNVDVGFKPIQTRAWVIKEVRYLLTILLVIIFILIGRGEIFPVGREYQLYFGFTPLGNSLEVLKRERLWLDYLSKATGIKFIPVVCSSEEIINKLKNKTLDLAWVGPVVYLKAEKIAKTKPLVSFIRKDGFYRGIIVTHKESGINSFKDLKGKKFAFVDKNSASGYLYPYLYLEKQGLNINRDLSSVYFLGSHQKVIQAVYLQDVSAGAVYEGATELLRRKERINKIKILARTEPIPADLIISGRHLNRNLYLKLKKLFLQTSQDLTFKERFGFYFKEVNTKDYQRIKEMLRRLKM